MLEMTTIPPPTETPLKATDVFILLTDTEPAEQFSDTIDTSSA